MARAYAVKVDGELLLHSVMDTERGAKVNGIVRLYHVMPTNDWTDSRIEQEWEVLTLHSKESGNDVRVVPVEVTEIET